MDAQARFDALYRENAGEVRRYVRRRWDTQSADDVVADVFVVAWRRLGGRARRSVAVVARGCATDTRQPPPRRRARSRASGPDQVRSVQRSSPGRDRRAAGRGGGVGRAQRAVRARSRGVAVGRLGRSLDGARGASRGRPREHVRGAAVSRSAAFRARAARPNQRPGSPTRVNEHRGAPMTDKVLDAIRRVDPCPEQMPGPPIEIVLRRLHDHARRARTASFWSGRRRLATVTAIASGLVTASVAALALILLGHGNRRDRPSGSGAHPPRRSPVILRSGSACCPRGRALDSARRAHGCATSWERQDGSLRSRSERSTPHPPPTTTTRSSGCRTFRRRAPEPHCGSSRSA